MLIDESAEEEEEEEEGERAIGVDDNDDEEAEEEMPTNAVPVVGPSQESTEFANNIIKNPHNNCDGNIHDFLRPSHDE